MTKFKISTLTLIVGISMLTFVGCSAEIADAKLKDSSSSDGAGNSSNSSSSKDDKKVSSSSKASSSSKEVSSSTESSSSESSSSESSSSEVSSSSVSSSEESSSSLSSSSEESSSAGYGSVKATVPGTNDESWGEFMMGELRLLNNKWGSVQTKCPDASQEIFVNADHSFGWEFSRGSCGFYVSAGDSPDYPEVEIGIAPFDKTGPDAEVNVSTSDILPLQIKDINSASVTLDNYRIELEAGKDKSWNLNFELWVSIKDPRVELLPDPEIELMVFWGWNENRWGCDDAWSQNGVGSNQMSSNGKNYTLCHQSDTWGSDEKPWRYFQFRDNDGSPQHKDFTGKLDIKATLDWLVQHAGVSGELWVTRFEVGTEIDDNTAGKVTIDDMTYEVNGEERSPQFAN